MRFDHSLERCPRSTGKTFVKLTVGTLNVLTLFIKLTIYLWLLKLRLLQTLYSFVEDVGNTFYTNRLNQTSTEKRVFQSYGTTLTQVKSQISIMSLAEIE